VVTGLIWALDLPSILVYYQVVDGQACGQSQHVSLALSEVPGSRRQAELMHFERNHIAEEQDLDRADLWSSRSEDGYSHSYFSTAFDGSKLSEIG
jgi:hypothetical protein